jgi:hypothetical protein
MRFERTPHGCYNSKVPHVPAHRLFCLACCTSGIPMVIAPVPVNLLFSDGVAANNVRSRNYHSGQVAQVVERSPEKAGVGGSTPSLATNFFNHLQAIVKPPLWAIQAAIDRDRCNAASFRLADPRTMAC